MKRRQFLSSTGITLGLLALARNKVFANVFLQSYNFKPLRRNVGIFTEQGGTIAWLVNKEGIVVVDSEFPDPANHLITELKKTSSMPFKYLINTHHHGDHTSGNIAFKGIAEQIVAHENSAANQRTVALKNGTDEKQLYPDRTFKKDMAVRVGDEDIKLYYYGAGHTNGDALIHFENANIVHMGDLMFNRRYPFIDKPMGADIQNWIRVLEKALNNFDNETVFIFGHAADTHNVTGNKEDIKAFQNYLDKLLQHVASEIRAGKSREEILKVTFIPGASEWQGQGIERSLNAAFEELNGGR
ncbi:MAG TPA: MBL fold metallo-hydrolase [Sphingobacteriaceae bacterium]